MNKSARKKWLKTMADKAEDEDLKQAVLDDVLDDYGLTEDLDLAEQDKIDYLDVRGYGDEGTTTSDTDKDYGLHQFSDPKYKPAYTDKSFQTTPDKTGIGKNVKATQSGTPNKAVGKATATKISPEVKVKDGVATALHKEEWLNNILEAWGTFEKTFGKKYAGADKIMSQLGKAVDNGDKSTAKKLMGELDKFVGSAYMKKEDVDKAKDDSIEGPATGNKHKCPTHVKKEGYGYGKNISHTLSDNVVDKMNIYWYDSKEVSYMMPINEVEIVEAGYHNMKNHREKFKSTEKIAEELRKLPNPFKTIEEGNGRGEHDPHDMADAEVGSHPDWPEGKKKKKKVTEKRSVAFARKFYQKGDK